MIRKKTIYVKCICKVGDIKRVDGGIFYFEESEPDDVIYLVCGKQFFKKYYHQLENLKDRGWELVEVCPSSIFRKPASELLPEDQVFYRNHPLRWEMVISRLAFFYSYPFGWACCLLGSI